MGVLSELEPKCVFEQFEKITKIPRGSGNEKKISDFLVEFAGERGLIAYQDGLHNVIILKPATPGMEDKETLILQAHMDMVCVCDDTSSFDFLNNPIEAYVDGKYIRAKGTTLGADDGIGMALILAVLASDSIPHPMIEAVFTSEEETGLGGANGLDYSKLSGKRIVNLDTEEENNLVIGCAGGCRVSYSGKCKKDKVEGIQYDIVVKGLKGGHSGTEIGYDHANANNLLGRILLRASNSAEVFLCSFEGGTMDNAICNHAKASVIVKKKTAKEFEKCLESLIEDLKNEYPVSEPDMNIKVKEKGKAKEEVISSTDFEKVIGIINTVPSGVIKYSQSIENMVTASANIGIVRVKPKSFEVHVSLRGNRNSHVEDLIEKTRIIALSYGCNYEITGSYCAWECEKPSDYALKIAEIYRERFGKNQDIISIHAGLECACFADKVEGADIISIGPDISGAHTTHESLDIESVAREWELLQEILKIDLCREL